MLPYSLSRFYYALLLLFSVGGDFGAVHRSRRLSNPGQAGCILAAQR